MIRPVRVRNEWTTRYNYGLYKDSSNVGRIHKQLVLCMKYKRHGDSKKIFQSKSIGVRDRGLVGWCKRRVKI